MKAGDFDPVPLNVIKGGYDPDRPRVPAGNPDGGQWTSDESETPATTAELAPADFTIIKEPPHDAKIVIPSDGVPISGGDPPKLLIAPPRADFRQVFAAGQTIALLRYVEQIRRGYAALHQGGTYDFQRDPMPAYANASNYAVGVYMAGAGYSLWETLRIAEAYAFFNSKNYNSTIAKTRKIG